MALHQASGRARLGLALTALTAACWATLPIALKLTLEVLDPITLTWFRFLVAALPEGQVTREFGEEADQVEWVRPAVALERWEAGEMAIMPPTLISLAEVGEYATVADAMAASASRTIFPVQPHAVTEDDKVYLVLPGDPAYRAPTP